MDLSHHREEYAQGTIDTESVAECPYRQFETWFQQANETKLLEPNAMTLATVDEQGRPTQRNVLLKYYDRAGFVFFTNYGSRKASQIAENPHVSLLFSWLPLQRQVEINGRADKISSVEALKYFALRPRGSQLAAWVSNQSTVVSTKTVLKNKLAEFESRFARGAVPMPPHWGGFRVTPTRFEFWQGGLNRLHDRIEYLTQQEQNGWLR